MQFDERKKYILGVIVKLYIATGEPVGSKLIVNMTGLNLSSATIRNEMSELAEMGYLEQPHTSAGRVPSQMGYRMFVDSLMEAYRLTAEEKSRIDELLKIESTDLESLLENAGELLARLTGCASLSAAPQDGSVSLRRVEIVPAGRRSMLLVLLTASGVIKSRLCRVEDDLDTEMLSFFSRMLNERLGGKALRDATPELEQAMAGELYEYTYTLRPVLRIVFEEIRALTGTEVFLGGETNLLSHLESAKALDMIRFLEKREELARLVEGVGKGVSVRIGGEIGPSFMRDSSLIAAPYQVGGHAGGTIGIIGPTRMDYSRLVSNLEYFSTVLSRLINETFSDV